MAVEIGDVFKLGPKYTGIRVIGLQGRSTAAPFGRTTLRRAIRKEVGRRTILPYVLVGLVVIAAVVVTIGLLDSADRRHQREQVRVERDRMRMEQELDVRQSEFTRKLSNQQEGFDSAFASQREKFDAALKLQQEETQRQLDELAVSDRDKFADVLKQYRESVFLILVHARARIGNRVVGETGGWGTGWVVRADGLVVTNKHVVQPWKTDAQWQALLMRHPETRMEFEIYAWPAGQRFLASNNKPPNEDTGYNTTKLKNLTLLGTPSDDWRMVKTRIDGNIVTSRVMASSDADLALLKLTGGPFTPIPVKADPTTMQELDSVMLLGFPLGQQVLYTGRADLSASLGNIRFVSSVVNHTASAFHGNSGGPLLSLDGEVIGVLTRGAVVEQGVAETMTMAIRSDALLRFLENYR
jgi:S1-C subfamily serine protease